MVRLLRGHVWHTGERDTSGMAQRSYRPPRNNRSNSPIAIVAASILLIVVVAIVAWLLFAYKGSGSSAATPTSVAANTASTSTSTSTASAAAQATTPGTAASSAVASAGATESATASATSTIKVTPSPAETATVEPTPTVAPSPTPLVGDYGALPSADVPSGSPGSGRLQLAYHLNMSLQQVPQQAAVYSLESRAWSASDAATLAKSLGISGDVQDQGNGSFRASGNGELYISNSLVQYIAPPGGGSATPTDEQLPGNSALVQIAHDWLVQQNLLGAAIGAGSVTSRDENSNVAQVQFKPVEPDALLSAIPSANVTIGAGGSVTEAFVRWPASMPRSNYGLRSAAALWSDASNGHGYVEVDDSALPSVGGALTGDATITSASIAYTTAGDPETQQYLVPLVVFEGQATVQGADAPVPIKIYVSAVGAQAAPRG